MIEGRVRVELRGPGGSIEVPLICTPELPAMHVRERLVFDALVEAARVAGGPLGLDVGIVTLYEEAEA